MCQKLANPERPHLKWAIDQLGIVCKLVGAKPCFVNPNCCCTCGHFPVFDFCRDQQLQTVLLVFLTFYPQAKTGSIKESTLSIQPRCTHRIV